MKKTEVILLSAVFVVIPAAYVCSVSVAGRDIVVATVLQFAPILLVLGVVWLGLVVLLGPLFLYSKIVERVKKWRVK